MPNAPRSILILGHGGFIGNRLCLRLDTEFPEARLHGFDIRSKRFPGLTPYTGDLRDERRVAEVLKKSRPDWIFHMAGSPSLRGPAELFESHLETTLSLFLAVSKRRGAKPRILIPGSAAEYGILGPKQLPVRESAPSRPANAYGYAKAAQTELSRVYARRGLDVVVARMFNILGPGLDPRLALSSFVDQTVRIERGSVPALLRVGDLSPKRDFVSIEEAVSALIRIARRGRRGEIYNIASGRSVSMRLLTARLIQMAKRPIRLSLDRTRLRPIELPDMRGSTYKTSRETGWRAKTTPVECLAEMLAVRRSQP